MSNIYVRSSGNDGTGTGQTTAPFASLSRAFAAATGGDVILVGDGTYTENTGGTGYLNISQSFSSQITVAPETGMADKVIITSPGTANYTVVCSGKKITFDQITFRSPATTVTSCVRFTSTGGSDVRFNRCSFVIASSSTQNNIAVHTSWSVANSTIAGLSFTLCTFSQTGHVNADALLLDNTGTGSTASVEIRDCHFRTGGFGMRLQGMSNVKITDNTVDSWYDGGGRTAFQLGVDGANGATCSGIITGNTFRTINGHGAVIGAGANNVLFADNSVVGGNNSGTGQGLVVKQAQNITLLRNTIHAGYNSGLYFKGSNNCSAFDNIVYNSFATSPALRVGINDDGTNTACSNLTVRRNYFYAQAGSVIWWGDSTHDSGGSYCDENVYATSDSATLGTIRGATVQNIVQLKASWGAYNRPVNDQNSKVGANSPPFAGTPNFNL